MNKTKEEGKRLCAEISYEGNPNLRVKIGTVNKKDPQVIFISCNCWATPQVQLDRKEYDKVIEKITDEIRYYVKDIFINTGCFDRKNIFDMDICTEEMVKGKSKYLNFDLYLKQNQGEIKGLNEIEPYISSKLKTLFNDIIDLFKKNDFVIGKTKY